MARIVINPMTRIEGHLAIEVDVQDGKVVDAKSKGEMFRGWEEILIGRNPVDANQITQRICGVCPVSHGLASSKCLDSAFNIKTNKNGRLLRNICLGANYLQSHILHFYHLSALDYIDITAILNYKGSDGKLTALKSWAKSELATKKGRVDEILSIVPFLPRYEGKDIYIKDPEMNHAAIAHYLQALDIRMKTHKMVAIFGGRVPHLMALVPGGVTTVPTRAKIREYKKILREVERFVNEVYIHDVIAVTKAFPQYFTLGRYDQFLSYGAFDMDDAHDRFMLQQGVYVNGKIHKLDTSRIREQVSYARYRSGSNLHPIKGETEADPHKQGAYTWVKAPRYNGQPLEAGALPRIAVSYFSGNAAVKKEVDALLRLFNKDISAIFSVLGRHACRAIEAKLLCRQLGEWVEDLDAGGSPRKPYEIPDQGEGEGLVEAPRGALGHWIVVQDRKIANYQCVVPTTWFCSPRDDKGVMGPLEQALIGTPVADSRNPIEVARVVRSFDPCLACAIHIVESGRDIANFKVC